MNRIESMQLKMKETLISICELLVLCVFRKYAQQMKVCIEQQSEEVDTFQRDTTGFLVIRYKCCHMCLI